MVKTGSEAAREFYIRHPKLGVVANTEDAIRWMAAYARERELLRLREAAKRTCQWCGGDGEHGKLTCDAEAIHDMIAEIEAEEQP